MPEPMDAREIDREARGIWENIAEEFGDRRGLAGVIARTYLLARDLQRFADGARVKRDTLLSVPKFLYNVLARSRGMALAS